jgi:hypothetical protein
VTGPPTYTFTAVYSGDSNFAGSTSAAVSKTSLPTTTTVTFLPSSLIYGQSLTVTATVSAAFGTPTGTVTFTDQTTSATLASNVNVSSGIATVAVSILGAGSHSIQAVYKPTGSTYLPSSGANTVTITKASASTALTLSGNTLTVTVAAIAPGAGMPTGTVQLTQFRK